MKFLRISISIRLTKRGRYRMNKIMYVLALVGLVGFAGCQKKECHRKCTDKHHEHKSMRDEHSRKTCSSCHCSMKNCKCL